MTPDRGDWFARLRDHADEGCDSEWQDVDLAVQEIVMLRARFTTLEAWAARIAAALEPEHVRAEACSAVFKEVYAALAAYPGSSLPGYFRAPGQPWPGTPIKETP